MTAELPLVERLRIRLTKYVPHEPTSSQAAFLLLPHREALYGGAAGGGKSDALLMAGLQYVDVPGYAGILFRRSFPELAMPGGLMARSHEWLDGSDAAWDGTRHLWLFPSGATLSFGHIQYAGDEQAYRSSEFQFVGFDELTTFLEHQYRYLFARLRRLEGFPVPIRLRSGSNPGGIGHDWVRSRFIPMRDPDTGVLDYPRSDETGELRAFLPAKIADNPYLDRDEYVASLSELDPVTRERLLRGDWDVREGGTMFQRPWFSIRDRRPGEDQGRLTAFVRRWDLAATPKTQSNDPDWTAGALVASRSVEPKYWVLDVIRMRSRPKEVEDLIQSVAKLDGPNIPIVIEQEPGASGKSLISYYQRLLNGYHVTGVPQSRSKEARAAPFASAAEGGNVVLLAGLWNAAFLEEAEAFPQGAHDDMLDVVVGGWEYLSRAAGAVLQSW